MLRILLTLCLVLPASLLPGATLEGKAPGVPPRTQVTVPYREDGAGRPLIEAGLSPGKKGVFLFDTGANINLMSPRTARQLNLEPQPLIRKDGSPARLPNGKPMLRITVPRLSLGELVYPEERFTLFDSRRVDAALGEPVDGILGVLAVSQSAVLLDFAKKTMTVWYPASLTAEERQAAGLAGASAIPMVEQGLRLQCRVRSALNGECEEDLLVDTGAPQTSISHRAATRLNLPLIGPPRTFHLPFGEEEVQLARLRSLQVGEHTVENLPVQVPVRDRDQTDPVLGLDVLSRFRVLIEFTDRKLYLAPRTAAK